MDSEPLAAHSGSYLEQLPCPKDLGLGIYKRCEPIKMTSNIFRTLEFTILHSMSLNVQLQTHPHGRGSHVHVQGGATC